MRAQTSTQINEIIATRRSPRSFNTEAEKLTGALLERELAPRQRLPLETIVVKGLPA